MQPCMKSIIGLQQELAFHLPVALGLKSHTLFICSHCLCQAYPISLNSHKDTKQGCKQVQRLPHFNPGPRTPETPIQKAIPHNSSHMQNQVIQVEGCGPRISPLPGLGPCWCLPRWGCCGFAVRPALHEPANTAGRLAGASKITNLNHKNPLPQISCKAFGLACASRPRPEAEGVC